MNDNINNTPSPDGETAPAPSFQTPFAAIREPAAWFTRDSVFAVITVILSVLFSSLSLFGGFALGFTISHFILVALTVCYLFKSAARPRPFPLFCGAASLLLSVIFTLYCDGFINFLLFIAVFALYGVFVTLSFTAEDDRGVIPRTAGTVIGSTVRNMNEPFRSYRKYCADAEKKGPNRQILLGIVISVPILAVVIPLLIHADAAFEGLMRSVFSGFGTLILKIITGVILALFLFSMLFAVQKKLTVQDGQPQAKPASRQNLSAATALTVLTVLSVFYFVYLLSQLAYFFSAFSGILPENYTFTPAAYARRGFFELCGVCSINLGLIALITGLAKRNEADRIPLSVRVGAAVICAFSFVFTATALSKMFLYIKQLGLTRLRLITSVFMILLVFLFLGVLLCLFCKKMPIAKYCITVLALFALVVGFCDVDKTVSQYNLRQYNAGALSEIDVEHLGTLSDSAVPALISLLDCKDDAVKDAAAEQLYERAEKLSLAENGELKENAQSDWKAYNDSRETAKRLITDNFEKIKAACEFPTAAYDYDFDDEY